jgi:DNA-binding NtrC family response regulator
MEAKQRVLVVEDDTDVRELIEECLATRCAVTLARDGIEALDMLSRPGQKFDALVLDLEMPRLSGVALVEELKNRDIHLPLLIVSGRPGARWQARELHAEFMSKPFDTEGLETKVEELLHQG